MAANKILTNSFKKRGHYYGIYRCSKLDKDPKDITPDYTLDTLGEPCPYPAIVMLETMPQLQKGEILELLSDCAQSINNIPVDTKTTVTHY